MHLIGALISWAVFGLIVGAIARLLVPGRQGLGLFATMLLGVAGSLLGGFLTNLVVRSSDGSHPAGWIMSIVGAIILVWIGIAVVGRRRTYI